MASEAPIHSSIVVDSRASSLREPCQRLLSALEKRGFSQSDVFAVHLAVEEVFLNAIKHGNKMVPDRKVVFEYQVDDEKVEIRMLDEGSGFDPQSIPDPRTQENLYRPEGRGLLLINSYMHVVEYNERGNGVRMIRYRSQPASSHPGPDTV